MSQVGKKGRFLCLKLEKGDGSYVSSWEKGTVLVFQVETKEPSLFQVLRHKNRPPDLF